MRLVLIAALLLVAPPAGAATSTIDDCMGPYDPNVGYFYGRGQGAAINEDLWRWRATYMHECLAAGNLHITGQYADWRLNSACGQKMFSDVKSFGICGAITLFQNRKLDKGGLPDPDNPTFCPSGQCLGCYPDKDGKIKSTCRCSDSNDCPANECCSFMFNVCGNIHDNYCPHHFYDDVYEGTWCWFHRSWSSWDNIDDAHDKTGGCGGVNWGIEWVDWVPWGTTNRPNECGHQDDARCTYCKGDMRWDIEPNEMRWNDTITTCYQNCCLEHPDFGICPYCEEHPDYTNCPNNDTDGK